ncbi:MAG: RDD family protein [Acidimicrobiia bacterium]
MSDDETYYHELGVDPGASRDELKAAYQERISELEAARESKGVTDAQLQRNREEVARVRAAWNVLADPFQRTRYDAALDAASANGDASGDDGEGEDGDAAGALEPSERPEVQLTGWRRLMAPPPPKQAKPAPGNGKQPPTRRPPREPTLQLPPGMRFAESRARGMALLFDFAIVLVIYWVTLLVVPGVVNSEYSTKVDQIKDLNSLHDTQGDINDARASEKDAKTASDEKSAQKDLNDANKEFNKTAKGLNEGGIETPHNQDALQKTADKLSDDIRGATYVASVVVLVASMLYLVPMTAITGRTLGMRGRKIRVARADGTPVGWYGSFTRFFLPILLALVIPTIGPLLGLGMVLWGYRDPNGQGIHDKLARTIVVADQ